MFYSTIFGKSIKDFPGSHNDKVYGYLYKGGFVRPLGSGLACFLPMGLRVLNNMKKIIREEMNNLEGHEVHMPIVSPLYLWEKSGRAEFLDKSLLTFNDRHGKSFTVSYSHEESISDLVKNTLDSYRDLPVLLYQFQSKYRDEEKVRSGLLHLKEFLMNDAYSFHLSYTSLNNFFPKVFKAYSQIFQRCGIEPLTAESSPGYMGGERAYGFFFKTEQGLESLVECEGCGYRANIKIARGLKSSDYQNPKPLQKVKTKDVKTIAQLCDFFEVDASSIAKSIFFKTTEGFVLAVVLGDSEVSFDKLAAVLSCNVIRKANELELELYGLNEGFLSPINVDETKVKVVIDENVANASNLIMGANEKDFHYLNANFGVDFESDTVADIGLINEEYVCKQCGGNLTHCNTIEIAKLYKLGKQYSRNMDITIHDDKMNKRFLQMGAYGISMNRLFMTAAIANSDDKGIIWPEEIAPFLFCMISIGPSLAVKRTVELIHSKFKMLVLFDDRNESIGVKLKDADVLGIPFRIVVSERLIQDGKVELKTRRTGEIEEISVDYLVKFMYSKQIEYKCYL
ncbi:MAG: proline--tRNA ligase [Spirochaetales bacterium]|nr:proline--tRNA ligase [Spirochaetales bacterium]